MAKESTIQHYSSSITGNTPSAVDLASGELAINTADEKVFLKNLLGNVVSLSQSKDLSGAFASKATVVTSFNGLTGAVGYSPAFASSSVTGVASFNSTYFAVGATGVVTLASAYQVTGDTFVGGGTGIAVSRSGNTSTVTNTGIHSFNGTTGSAITLTGDASNGVITIVDGEKGNYNVNTRKATTSLLGVASFSSSHFSVNTGVVTLSKVPVDAVFASSSVTGVASFKSTFFDIGATGVVTLASAYQVTGDTIAAGTGISVSRSGNTSTVTNIGVQSFNGLTGAVTGVTAGGINTFTRLNTFSAGISSSGITGSLPSIMSDGAGTLTITAKSSMASTPDNAVITLVGGDYDGIYPNGPTLSSMTLEANQINLGSSTVNSTKLVYSVNGATGPVVIGGGTGIVIGSSGKTFTVTNKGVQSFNGLTGAVGYSPAFASSSVTGVASFNSTYFAVGATGVVTLVSAYQVTGDTVAAGTGISVSRSGNTSTVTNIGVQSFNGATGAVTGASLGANTFTALNSFNAGISASALTVSGTITSTEGITFGSGTTFMAFVPKTAANDGGLWLRDGLFQVGGGVFAPNNGSLQYNMNSELFSVYGYQVIDNAAPYQGTTTPLTVKGGTGQSVPLFNVTRGGTSAVQVHQDGYLAIPVDTSPAIKIGTHDTRNLTLASIDGYGEILQTGAGNHVRLNIRQEGGGSVSIGDVDETNNNTYIEVTDNASLIVLNAGEIYLNGTILNPLVLANAESIQNTVNGRIDFMPGPTAAGAYGLYADLTGWGYGVQMGTINSAGTLDSSPGGIMFNDTVSFAQDKYLQMGSDGTHALVKTTTGLDTLQIAVSSGVGNSNAVAIVGDRYVAAGTANRSPVTSHTNPNLYIYRAGITSANDFIRIEHDGTNGNIVAGGTSGIKISGLLDVASGLIASGATFSGDITVNSVTVGRGGGGDYRNTAVGNGALLQNTGIGNAGMGTYALGANTSGSNKTAIGYAAGYYRGSGGVSTLTTGTGGIYIGYQARGSADTQTNEIVIGVDALGLGSNTAVIGATTQSAATVYGVLNLPSGLSAAGATFSGNISAPNIVNSFNGATGDVVVTGLDLVLFNLGII